MRNEDQNEVGSQINGGKISEGLNAKMVDPDGPNPETQKAFSQPFGWALKQAQNGNKIIRNGWNGKGMWVSMRSPREGEFLTHPYLYIEYPVGHAAYPEGSKIPWLASQSDIMATDWEIMLD